MIPRRPQHNRRAVALGLPPDTPDNVVRGYFFAMRANNRAHRVKADYDANHPPPAPLSDTTGSPGVTAHDVALPASPLRQPGD